jgi:hypothetical protein
MAAVPMKPQYGPTLGRLLAPRWHAASRPARGAVIALGIALVVLMIGAALTLENAKYSRGGPVPFSFSYRGLYRVTPEPGSYVKVEHRSSSGRLEDSFAVRPLRLPAYAGGLSGELPLYAAGHRQVLAQRDPQLVMRGEGKTRVNTVPAYNIFYTTVVEGRLMYGRNVLLLPEKSGAREGVEIVMLTSPTANAQVTSPSLIASAGILERPVETFSIG